MTEDLRSLPQDKSNLINCLDEEQPKGRDELLTRVTMTDLRGEEERMEHTWQSGEEVDIYNPDEFRAINNGRKIHPSAYSRPDELKADHTSFPQRLEDNLFRRALQNSEVSDNVAQDATNDNRATFLRETHMADEKAQQ